MIVETETALRLRSNPASLITRFYPDILALALLAGLTLAFFWRILTPNPHDRAAFPAGDFTEQFYPFALFRFRELLAGHLPTWNPYAYGGHPFLADIQSAVYYPIGWVTSILARSRGYPVIALETEAVLHFWLAAAFTYLLGRRLFGSRLASLVAALAFAFGGYLTGYPPLQLPILEVQVWLPLVLLGIFEATRLAQDGWKRLAWGLGAGVALGCSILAGHPQAAMYVVYAVLSYWLFRLGCMLVDSGRGVAWAAAIRSGVFLPVSIGLAAAQLLPTAEFMRLSSRAEVSFAFTSNGFPLFDWLQLVLPGSVSLYSPMYVGILPLTLAMLAVTWVRHREVWFWLGGAIFSLLLSFGAGTVVYSLLYLLAPGFSTFRQQERAAFLLSFSLAMLAGYGARQLITTASSIDSVWRQAGRVLLWATLVAGALTLALHVARTAGANLSSLPSIAGFTTIIFLLTALLFAVKARGVHPRAVGSLAVAIVVLDLFSVNQKTNVAAPQTVYPDSAFMQQLVAYARQSGTRVHNEFQLPANYGMVYGVSDIGGASPLEIQRYKDLMGLPWERRWQLLAVGQFVNWEARPDVGRVTAQEPSDGDKRRFLMTPSTAPSRVHVVHRAIIAPTDPEAIAVLQRPDFDPAQAVVLPAPPPIALDGGAPKGEQAHIVDEGSDWLVVEADLERPGLLVVSDVWYPGWKARDGGQEVPVLRANHALRAIPLQPGYHRVELRFESQSIQVGAAVSLVTAAIVLAAFAFLVIRRRPGDRMT